MDGFVLTAIMSLTLSVTTATIGTNAGNELANRSTSSQAQISVTGGLNSTNFVRPVALLSNFFNESHSEDSRSSLARNEARMAKEYYRSNTRWNPVSRVLLAVKVTAGNTLNDDDIDDYFTDWESSSFGELLDDETYLDAIILPPNSDGSELFNKEGIGSKLHENLRSTRKEKSQSVGGNDVPSRDVVYHQQRQESNNALSDDFDNDEIEFIDLSPKEKAKYAHIPNGLLVTDMSQFKKLRKPTASD